MSDKRTINILVENGCVVEVDISSFPEAEREKISINIMDLDTSEDLEFSIPVSDLPDPVSLAFIPKFSD